jgi:NAD-dependent SIR2 family protein deacetylase
MADVDPIHRAAELVKTAEALVITAGAGMGVDSGLPDFRSNEGFWNAYPPFRHLALEFSQVANPRWFRTDPALAWGFYGHRLALYRRTQPHAGFEIVLRWAKACPAGFFVFTSNVDGHFQRAGFPEDRIVEIHGSIHRLQSLEDANGATWSANEVQVEVDLATMRAMGTLPANPRTGNLARPNILMFGDAGWNPAVTEEQHRAYSRWLGNIQGRHVVVLELGAGTAIPTVRAEGELLMDSHGGTLVRINPREYQCPRGAVPIPRPAMEALQAIEYRFCAMPA